MLLRINNFNQMKKTVILFFMIATICSLSCNTTKKSTIYSVGLKHVDSPSDIEKNREEILAEVISDDERLSYLYEDELMRILWNVNTEVFAFALENKSAHSLEILWDDMLYFDWQGYVNQVIHKGVKYVNRNSPQISTIVPQDSTIADYLLPVSNIYRTSGFFNTAYAIKELFPVYQNQHRADKSNLTGKTIKIKFPLIVDGNKKEYLFAFQIDSVVVGK